VEVEAHGAPVSDPVPTVLPKEALPADEPALSGFAHYGQVDHVSRHWLAAFFTSSAVYIVIGILVVVIGTATKQIIAPPKEPVKVTFVEKIARPEPPPEPVPIIEAPKPQAPRMEPRPRDRAPAAAAVVPKDMKVRKLDAPPPPKELAAPEEMPEEAPEIDPSLDKGIAIFGEPGTGDPAGLEGGVGNGAGNMAGFGLPAGAVAPKPYRSNRRPPYPPSAKKTRLVGTVIIECVIRADGRLEKIEVVRGEEPFVSVAEKAVQGWRYEPALHQGQPISVPHRIEIHFKLQA